jgi:threonine/homoserine/homoserine lactone efflux protein
MNGTHWLAFLITALTLLLIPGPAVIYIVTQSAEHGPRTGISAVTGITSAGLVHLCLATLGLSAVVAASVTAFNCVKLAGAAYLAFLGLSRLREGRKPRTNESEARPKRASVFWQGFAVQLLNPKIALFFLAFLPQFVDLRQGPVSGQIFVTGLSFILLGFATDSAYAMLAGKLASHLRGASRLQGIQKYVTSGVYLGLAAYAAAGGPGRK